MKPRTAEQETKRAYQILWERFHNRNDVLKVGDEIQVRLCREPHRTWRARVLTIYNSICRTEYDEILLSRVSPGHIVRVQVDYHESPIRLYFWGRIEDDMDEMVL